ncbi:hypothetical protein TMatcc_006500 [Talaromyces marneffei ATCC 18224]
MSLAHLPKSCLGEFSRSSAASNLSLRLLSRTHGLVSLNIAEFQLFNFTYGTCAEPLDSGFSSDMRFYNPQDRRKSWKKFDHSWDIDGTVILLGFFLKSPRYRQYH